VHVWLNRFPPPHLEGFEHLIQDPYKLNDEVRGRRDEFTRQLERGEPLDCREPSRCRYCYLEQLCDGLEEAQRTLHEHRFERVRLDAAAEAAIPPAFGGDPASSRRAQQGEPRGDGSSAGTAQGTSAGAAQGSSAGAAQGSSAGAAQGTRRVRLPLASAGGSLEHVPLPERARRSGARRFAVRAADLAEALEALAPFAGQVEELELELTRDEGLAEALDAEGCVQGARLGRVTAGDVAQAERLLGLGAFEVEVLLTRETGAWLESLPTPPARLALRQPTYERLTEAAEHDLDLPAFFRRFTAPVPVEGVPACILGRAPRQPPRTLDAAMTRPDGQLEIFRATRRHILEGYRSKSLRCRACAHDATCAGLHINQVRAHGYAWLSPVT
jgi:hypothetical protein